MNHVITHCSGEDIAIQHNSNDKPFTSKRIVCKKRDTCQRYLAYLDLVNCDSVMIPFAIAQECIEHNFKIYLETKQ